MSDTIGTTLPVDFEIQPYENDKVLYLRVAPPTSDPSAKARAMIFFTLIATNNTDNPVTAKELTVSFPGSNLDPFEFPSREVVIAPHKRRNVGLKDGDNEAEVFAEEIELDEFPTKIKIGLVMDGLPDGSISRTWDLGPHQKSYDFFAKPETGDFGEFVLLKDRHYYGGGGQHFGHDANVLGWNKLNGKLSTARTDGATNSDRFLWERPFYAMADGIILRAVDRHEDNPAPKIRAFNAKNVGHEYESADRIKAISVATLSESRILLATVTDKGKLQLAALEQDEHGEALTTLSVTNGPSAEQVDVIGISSTRAITATQTGTTSELRVWNLSADGKTVTEGDKVTIPGVVEVKSVRVSPDKARTHVVTVARTVSGTMSVSLWLIVNGKFHAKTPQATGKGGTIGAFDVTALDTPGRFTTAVRLNNGLMKVIVWDVWAEGGTGGGGTGVPDTSVPTYFLQRRGEEQTSGGVTELSIAKTSTTDQVATAVRVNEGIIKHILWDVDPTGKVSRAESMEEPGAATLVNLSFFKSFSLLTAFRTEAGNLRVIAWEAKDSGGTGTILRGYQQDRGPVDLIALTLVPTDQPTVVSAVRTASGTAKVILWQFSDSNTMWVKHGDEIVEFTHLRQGSIPDKLVGEEEYAKPPYAHVKRGDLLGRMGHSGKSGGPHLHIHAVRVRPELVDDVDQLVADLAAGKSVGWFRPLQFHGVFAMKNSNVKPGWKNNPMSELDGEGGYFDDYVVWPATK